jgi:DNA mismatch repair protein MutS
MPKERETPVRRQYLDIKKQYPGTIIFFRLGDFYETFDEDAEIVSRVLDIVLTSRNVGKGTRVPMAGIPHHAAENYLSRLIEKGYHVAICDQVGDVPVDGLMPREVVRVITPGTILESSLLPGDGNNYLASLVFDEKRAGIAYVDITTGEFAVTEIQENHLEDLIKSELLRLNPAEALFPENLKIDPEGLSAHFTPFPAWRFEEERCVDELKTHFKVKTLDGFGVRGFPYAIRAAGAILQYLSQTRADSLKLLTSLNRYSLEEFMTLDAATRRNWEFLTRQSHRWENEPSGSGSANPFWMWSRSEKGTRV